MKKSFFLFFLFFFCTNLLAQEKIVYLDVNFLLTESEAGKYNNNELMKINMINKRLLISIILQDKSSHNLSNSF